MHTKATQETSKKPHFASWEHSLLAKLANDLWDDNIKLREANEQLRNDNKDLSKINRELLKGDQDDWK